jgi:hypothetical protein
MTTETATPVADTPAAASEATTQQPADAGTDQAASPESAAETPEPTPEQLKAELEQLRRDKARMQRGIDRRTRQLAEERARKEFAQPRAHNPADDEDTVSLTRAELDQRIREEAQRLAPQVREQAAEIERRQGVIQSLTKTWGQEKFDSIAADLDDALGGLADRSGNPKPAVEAVFEADSPAQVIEYLADPAHAADAESLARMGPVQAGKFIARLEDRIKAEKAKAEPKPSSAAAPLERLRGVAPASKALADMSYEEFVKKRREQIKHRR